MALTVDPALALAARLGLALLFASAAWHKLRDLEVFRTALEGYRLVPRPAEGVAVFALIACELAIAGALVRSSLGGLPAALLLTLYTAAIALSLARGLREIDCGCFGPAARQPLSAGLVVRNLGMIALALVCTLPAGPRTLIWLDVVSIGAAVGLGAILYGTANTLLANAPRLRALRGA